MNNNKQHRVYLGLGTNLGDKEQNLLGAVAELNKTVGRVVSVSSYHATKAVGFDSDNMFLNATCEVETTLLPLEILEETQSIEKRLGRTTKSLDGVHTDRIIDIDILLFDDLVMNLPQLQLPHPHLHERTFVLYPLAEIARDKVHPTFLKTIGELKDELYKHTNSL